MAPEEADVWAVQPCLYAGHRLERGERLRLAGISTDARLIDEHYLQRLRPRHSCYVCERCTKAFVGGENFALHLVNAHTLTPDAAREIANAYSSATD